MIGIIYENFSAVLLGAGVAGSLCNILPLFASIVDPVGHKRSKHIAIEVGCIILGICGASILQRISL